MDEIFPVTRIDIKSYDNQNRDEAINSNVNKVNYKQNFIQIFLESQEIPKSLTSSYLKLCSIQAKN